MPIAMTSQGRVRLLVVDDYEVLRRLRALLQQAKLSVGREAGTIASAVEKTIRLKPDMVVMDVRLADGSGVEFCSEIRSLPPQTCVLFLTSFADEEVPAGPVGEAHGYLLKTIGRQALIDAVSALASERSLDPTVSARIVAPMQALEGSVRNKKSGPLAPQESRVLALLADGKTNKEIGVALGLSDKTIKNYVSHIFQKLQITRRAQAAAFYIRHCVNA